MSQMISGAIAQLRMQSTVAVDNLVALRALTKAKYSAAWLRGYTAAGDLGSGTYRLDLADTVTAENLPLVVVATDGGRWKLMRQEYLLVEQCGGGVGVADNAAAFNTALSVAAAAGIGMVRCASAGVYKVASTVIPSSNVILDLNGATVQATAAMLSVVANPNTGVLMFSGVRNGTIDGQNFATQGVLTVLSAYQCDYTHIVAQSNSTGVIAFQVGVNTAGATNPDGNRNTVFCKFDHWLQSGTAGQAMRTKGDVTVPTVVTLCTFTNFMARGANGTGINFDSWTDSITFSGVTRVQVTGAGGTGVACNTGTPATDVGVYDICFQSLYVDTFGAVGGRVGLQLNNCKNIEVGMYANNPQAEGGSVVINGAQSYHIVEHIPGTSNRVVHAKNAWWAGKDNPTMLFGGDSLSNQTASLVGGLGRTAAGITNVDLVGGTTYPAFGTRLIRNGEGSTQLIHRGATVLELNATDAGGSIGLKTSAGYTFLVNASGIGMNGAAPVAPLAGVGVPTNATMVANLNGSTATLAQVASTLAAVLVHLKSRGDFTA